MNQLNKQDNLMKDIETNNNLEDQMIDFKINNKEIIDSMIIVEVILLLIDLIKIEIISISEKDKNLIINLDNLIEVEIIGNNKI
jgi:hypothetical protein